MNKNFYHSLNFSIFFLHFVARQKNGNVRSNYNSCLVRELNCTFISFSFSFFYFLFLYILFSEWPVNALNYENIAFRVVSNQQLSRQVSIK